jgi:hypothetical protein
VYKIGDFVRTRGSDIYRIDQLFVHCDGSVKVLLLKVTPVVYHQGKPSVDPILHQPRLYLDRSARARVIIITSILPQKVWLVPVEEDSVEEGLLRYDRNLSSAEGGLIHVEWTIHYL